MHVVSETGKPWLAHFVEHIGEVASNDKLSRMLGPSEGSVSSMWLWVQTECVSPSMLVTWLFKCWSFHHPYVHVLSRRRAFAKGIHCYISKRIQDVELDIFTYSYQQAEEQGLSLTDMEAPRLPEDGDPFVEEFDDDSIDD